ncbi:TrkH family potassium uptake protein [Domibacillus epiphyticus]|uniref:Trk family potassium uptake protein n=1 Tax=Domibacillus epiphyticus TaxID=1714355 RepID=A0A1V2A7M7_9BACI|nr:TrkH family potassium uptake protein [Domibacillus epiphyticus]OMP67005.1 Trk family potassium uptake protein [Domibacillus epiphyticus]
MKKLREFLDPPKVLVLGFLTIILIGTFLLTLPYATINGDGLSFLNALFTATSAACVNGLVVVDTGSTFSTFGILVILSLIQIGGLGFMTFATFFAVLLGKRISLKERLVLRESMNSSSIEGIVKLSKRIIFFTVLIEIIGAIILSFRFAADIPTGKAIFFGIFHSISNFNNAGFDLTGEFKSLTHYVDDSIMTLTVCALITLGGIGFIVLNELYEYRITRRVSLHTKVVLATSFVLTFGGTILILLLEFGNPKTLQTLSHDGKLLAALFQSVAPRSAGSSTLNMADLTQSSLFLIMFLMFIGASPGSAGGGIKTTTFATLLGAVWSQIKGKEDVVFFRQCIPFNTIYKALTVTVSGLFLAVVLTMLLTITENNQDFLMILFEAVSASSNVGLSMGLTPDLSPIGRILVIIAMFAGRVGPLTIAYAIATKQEANTFRYPKGKMMIG